MFKDRVNGLNKVEDWESQSWMKSWDRKRVEVQRTKAMYKFPLYKVTDECKGKKYSLQG